jgi:hypothetical protein
MATRAQYVGVYLTTTDIYSIIIKERKPKEKKGLKTRYKNFFDCTKALGTLGQKPCLRKKGTNEQKWIVWGRLPLLLQAVCLWALVFFLWIFR